MLISPKLGATPSSLLVITVRGPSSVEAQSSGTPGEICTRSLDTAETNLTESKRERKAPENAAVRVCYISIL